MYTIICDGEILHDPRLELQKTFVIEPKLTLELNKQGTLEFQMPPVHPLYRDIKKLKSEISVFQDGEWLWSGRVLNDETDIYNMKTFDCEGELSYLIDSIQSFAEYHDTPVAQYFNSVMSKHNALVDEHKRFTVGIVNVEDSNDSLYRFSDYESTWDTINDKLIDRLGGYIRTRRGASGEKIIDYIADYDHINTQVIEFGQNLLSFKRTLKGEDVATVLVPLGAKQETGSHSSSEAVPRLTIASVNGGKTYIEDPEAVDLYGRIVQTEIWDDVTDASNLLNKGRSELLTRRLLSDSIELTAVDMHHLDIDVEKIKLGDKIRVFSIPHGLDIYMTVTKMVINLTNLADTVITLGKTSNTLTDTTNANKSKAAIQKVVESYGYGSQIVNNYNTIQEVNNTVTLFGRRLDESETVKPEDLEALVEAINHLQEAISKSGTLTSIDSSGGGTAVGKTATEVGKFDVDEPTILRKGLILKDGTNEYNVLEIIKNLGGVS